MKYKLIAFDAYGTLFDVYSISELIETIFPNYGEMVSLLWRDKQIEYTRLITMSDPNPSGSRHYLSFQEISIRSLRYACKKTGLILEDINEKLIMAKYSNLPLYRDCERVLKGLKDKGVSTTILSNGNEEMLNREVITNNLTSYFDEVLSVEKVKLFKTAPQTYDLVLKAFPLNKKDILFVSSNAWDVIGASWFGFDVFWVNRFELPFEEIGNKPNYESNSLEGLLELVK